MKTLEYVITHFYEFEEDIFEDDFFVYRFITNFIPQSEWGKWKFKTKNEEIPTVREWNENNILDVLKYEVFIGYTLFYNEGSVVHSKRVLRSIRNWCKILENGVNIELTPNIKEISDWYNVDQLDIVDKHYQWDLKRKCLNNE